MAGSEMKSIAHLTRERRKMGASMNAFDGMRRWPDSRKCDQLGATPPCRQAQAPVQVGKMDAVMSVRMTTSVRKRGSTPAGD